MVDSSFVGILGGAGFCRPLNVACPGGSRQVLWEDGERIYFRGARLSSDLRRLVLGTQRGERKTSSPLGFARWPQHPRGRRSRFALRVPGELLE